MMEFCVTRSNMSGTLLMAFGSQIIHRCPELSEWLGSELILRKNFSRLLLISNVWFRGSERLGYAALHSEVLEGGSGEAGKESMTQTWALPATRQEIWGKRFISMAQFAQL